MPRPLLIFSQSDYVIRIVTYLIETVQIQISWLLQKPTDVCKGRVNPGSAGQGLKIQLTTLTLSPGTT